MRNRGLKRKRVLFYASVPDKSVFFIQQFYQVDTSILKDMGYDVSYSNQVLDAFKFWRYDFVFAYFYRYSLFVALIAKLLFKNTYFTGGIDALDPISTSKRDYEIQKYLFKCCYFIAKNCIIVSRSDQENVRHIVGGKKLSFSEHTINTSNFDCDISSKENVFTTIAWQGTVGNVKRKGVDKALELFARLKKMPGYSDYVFYIIGKEGAGTEYIVSVISKLNLQDSVILTGSVSEEQKIIYLKKSKFYFQLSSYEGFGVAALEALCAQNVFIHSGRGGLSNPIYSDCILIDIEKPFDEMFADLCEALQRYDYRKLSSLQSKVHELYDNDRRKKDFINIIKE